VSKGEEREKGEGRRRGNGVHRVRGIDALQLNISPSVRIVKK